MCALRCSAVLRVANGVDVALCFDIDGHDPLTCEAMRMTTRPFSWEYWVTLLPLGRTDLRMRSVASRPLHAGGASDRDVSKAL